MGILVIEIKTYVGIFTIDNENTKKVVTINSTIVLVH